MLQSYLVVHSFISIKSVYVTDISELIHISDQPHWHVKPKGMFKSSDNKSSGYVMRKMHFRVQIKLRKSVESKNLLIITKYVRTQSS